jgi:hypothetical protein
VMIEKLALAEKKSALHEFWDESKG